ncbi:MAG: 50S ribosomal protein L22 [Candidatus Kerfeldbacteria bacterium]|nr:50S ribosomal protein L22 [Candidatus Kerfeldbacteria bacterium]
MTVRASLRYLRMSPRKVRLVVDGIRGLSADAAERQLLFSPKQAAKPVLKLLRSAIANAEHNFKLRREGLTISTIVADGGPVLKRFQPRAFGSAAAILKRSTHVTLILSVPEPSAAKHGWPEKEQHKGKQASEKGQAPVASEKVRNRKKQSSRKTASSKRTKPS